MNKEEKKFTKCPFCERSTHKESKYCIFHTSAKEKTKKEFKDALKEYVNKIKKEDDYYDFKKFIFVGNIYFKKGLSISTFKNTNFRDATFKGIADFNKVSFEKIACFKRVSCEKIANFQGATFKGDTNFAGGNI